MPEALSMSPGGGESRGAAAAASAAAAVERLRREGAERVRALHTDRTATEERYKEACDAREASLREHVAAGAETMEQENRAIDIEWERASTVRTPQDMLAASASVQADCSSVLAAKDALVHAINEELGQRDADYVELLRTQAEETDALAKACMQDCAMQATAHTEHLAAVEAAYLQERAELMAATKTELEALLERRGTMEQRFMDQYLAACGAYEDQLEMLRKAEAREYSSLKKRLDDEVGALEAHLDGMQPVYALHQDKLSYNYRVLMERERENKEALMQQKRRVNRQWEALAQLKKRSAELDRRLALENARLTDEYEHLTRAFNHLQGKYAHFRAADQRKFEQVQTLKQEELTGLAAALRSSQGQLTQFMCGASGVQNSACSWESSSLPAADESDGLKLESQPDAAPSAPGLIAAYRQEAAVQQRPTSSSSGNSSTSSESAALSRDHWDSMASTLTGEQLGMHWALVESELAKHLTVLQARMRLAGQVTTLQRENQELKSRLRTALAHSASCNLPPAAGAAGDARSQHQ